MKMNTISQELVKSLFDYREDGVLIRKTAPASNTKIGDVAGSLTNKGYHTTAINSKVFLCHRLIYIYHHGYIPEFLDHIDRDPSNDKIENLRPATNSQNLTNSNKRRDYKGKVCSSEFKGVCFDKQHNNYSARITKNGKSVFLGRFTNEIDAAKAYNKKAKELHGEFANLNTFSKEELNMETINKQITMKEWI